MTNQNSNVNPYGYDIVDEVPKGGGNRMSLKHQGEQVQIRLVSKPVYVKRYWVMAPSGKKTPIVVLPNQPDPYGGKDVPMQERIKPDYRFGWIVIDRVDQKVKIFEGPKTIAFKIKALSEMKDQSGAVVWGDPFGYDLLLCRTEQKGPNYYTVQALPQTRVPLLPAEIKKVQACGIDLFSQLAGSKKATSSAHTGANELETLPQRQAQPIVQPMVQPVVQPVQPVVQPIAQPVVQTVVQPVRTVPSAVAPMYAPVAQPIQVPVVPVASPAVAVVTAPVPVVGTVAPVQTNSIVTEDLGEDDKLPF